VFWSHLNSLCEHEVKTKKNFGCTQVNQIVWPVVIVFKFLRVGGVGGGWKWVGVLLWGWGPHASQTYPKPNNLHYFAAHMPLPPTKPNIALGEFMCSGCLQQHITKTIKGF
jgi:hypothetical protein